MGIEKLISAAVSVVMLMAATGQLPRFINGVRKAQFQLLQESKASKWPKLPMLAVKR